MPDDKIGNPELEAEMPNRKRKQSMTRCCVGDHEGVDLDRMETRDPVGVSVVAPPKAVVGAPTLSSEALVGMYVVKYIHKSLDSISRELIPLQITPATHRGEDMYVLVLNPEPPHPKIKVGSQLWLTQVSFGNSVVYMVK